jgi:hypothetical protein
MATSLEYEILVVQLPGLLGIERPWLQLIGICVWQMLGHRYLYYPVPEVKISFVYAKLPASCV